MFAPVITNQSLLEALPVAVYLTDAEGRITYYNPAAVELWGGAPAPNAYWCGSWKLFRPDGSPLPHDECPMALALKEKRPVRGVEAILERPDGSRVIFAPYPTPLFDDSGQLTGAINMLMDVTKERDSAESANRLAAVVSSSDDAIVSKTLQGVVTSWNHGAERIFGYTADEMIGRHITTIIPPHLHEEEQRIIAQLARGERIEHYETVRVAKDGSQIDISLSVSPIRDSSGRIVGASKVARDVSERKRAEETQRLLLDELSHRIKNTLATVQALATQTVRHARQPSEFLEAFSARLQALGAAHSLLSDREWRGIGIRELVQVEVRPFDTAEQPRMTISGADLLLSPDQAVGLGLILHELASNALQYGSLSAAAGKVDLDWKARGPKGARRLVLTWRESGGPEVASPERYGFGSILIRRSLAKIISSEVTHEFRPEGVFAEISMPLEDLSK